MARTKTKWWPLIAPTSAKKKPNGACVDSAGDVSHMILFTLFNRPQKPEDIRIGGSLQEEPLPMAFYTLAGSEPV